MLSDLSFFKTLLKQKEGGGGILAVKPHQRFHPESLVLFHHVTGSFEAVFRKKGSLQYETDFVPVKLIRNGNVTYETNKNGKSHIRCVNICKF